MENFNQKRKLFFIKEDEKQEPQKKKKQTTTLNPCCEPLENTSTILNRYKENVKLLSRDDLKLLIDILEGRKDNHFIESCFSMTREFQSLLFDIAEDSIKIYPTPTVITPAVVAFIAFECSFDYLYTHVDDDEAFVLLSLLVGVNNKFFCKNTNTTTTTRKERVDSFSDFTKIKNRWELLNDIAESFSNQRAGTNPIINSLVSIVSCDIRGKLFEKLIKTGLDYAKDAADKDPFDAAFILPWINVSNFEIVSNLIRRNVITVFNTVKCNPDCKKEYWDYYAAGYDQRIASSTVIGLGFSWKHTARNSTLRKHLIDWLVNNFWVTLSAKRDKKEAKVSQTLTERVNCFASLVACLRDTHVLIIIRYWPIPSNLLMSFYENFVQYMYEGCSSIYASFPNLVVRFHMITERVLKEFGIQNINKRIIDKGVKIFIKSKACTPLSNLFEKYKDSFSVYRVKEYARYIVYETNGCYASLKVLLEKFPWLLSTWINNSGDTLLCLCIKYLYPNLRLLLHMPLVKKHIDVENKDGLTPLMLAADYSCLDMIETMSYLIKYGKSNVNYVNRNHETVFHRVAASNNYKGLLLLKKIKSSASFPIVELRRKGDGATALMIALARENVDVAFTLMEDFGAKATTKFGLSTSLRTVEAMFLKCKNLSLSLLAEFCIHPNRKIIADSFNNNSLFEEEALVAMTGVETNNAPIFQIREKGDVFHRLKYNNKQRGFFVDDEAEDEGNCRVVVRTDDFYWTLFNENQCSIQTEWVKLLLNNKQKEMNTLIREMVKKDFGNDKCPICLKIFTTTGERGITECGHAFHAECWTSSINTQRNNLCPLCRTDTTFTKECFMTFHPEPNLAGLIDSNNAHLKERIFRKKLQPEINNGEEANEAEIYTKVARYEFFINNEWVDESSLSNEI